MAQKAPAAVKPAALKILTLLISVVKGTSSIYNQVLGMVGTYTIPVGGQGKAVFFGTDASAISGLLYVSPTSSVDPNTKKMIPDGGVTIELAFGACKEGTKCIID
jgi:hypothetical protein